MILIPALYSTKPTCLIDLYFITCQSAVTTVYR